MIPAEKKCSRCQTVKPAALFYTRRNGTGLTQLCTSCSCERVQEWRHKYPDRYQTLLTRTYKRRDADRRDRNVALLGEPDRCEICGVKFAANKQKGPQYDHNHGTGDARGWLCGPCNIGLGSLGDNPRILERAAEYLRKRGHAQSRPVIT